MKEIDPIERARLVRQVLVTFTSMTKNRGFAMRCSTDFRNCIRKKWILCVTPLMMTMIGVAQDSPFTTEDALRIKSFSIQSITDDGRFIAGTISQNGDRLNVDHTRYRDATYISPQPAEVVVLDTDTNEMHSLFTEKRQAKSFTWSPDGKTLAFFLLRSDQYHLHIYERETKEMREIEIQPDKAISSGSFLHWTKDGTGLIFALRENGWADKATAMFKEATIGPITVYDSRKPFLKWDELRDFATLQIPVKVDLKSREVVELLPESRYGSLRQTEDGAFMSYVETHPIKTAYEGEGSEYALLLLDLQKMGDPKVLIKRNNKRLNLSWNEENTMFAWADEGDIYMQSIQDDEPRNMTKDETEESEDDEKKVRFSMIRWSPDGAKLLARTRQGFWLIDRQSGDREMFYEFSEEQETERGGRGEPQPVSVAAWSPDSRYLYMTYSAKDRWERGYTRYDLQSRRMTDLVKDSNLYGRLTMSKDGEKFFYSFSDGDMPNDLYWTDKDFKAKHRLTDMNPWIANKTLTKSELLKYLDVDGKELFGILYYPVNYEPGKRYPLVCEIYEKFFDNGFNQNMNLLANAGFFGLRPSVNLVMGYPGEAWLKGVTSAINKLIDRGLVDPKKLGVHGSSYGGYATSLLITQTNRFAAAINISGKTNIISFLGDSQRIGIRNYQAAESRQDRIGATLWEQPMKYINHSAVMFADRVETPHLLISGEGDWNVPAGNTREMYYALRRLGKECVWVNYYNGGHSSRTSSTESEYHDKWNRMIDWYKSHFDKADEKEEKKK
jgi:dipeptidyl aminopeptidase/acylaminoacyl peptidase